MKVRNWLAASLLVVSATATAQQRIDRPGTVAHPSAGAHFPERVGEFERANIYQFDSGGRDLSATYNLFRGDSRLVLTVYVYPVARIASAPGSGGTAGVARATLCQREMANVGQVIENQNRNARRIEQGAAPSVDGVGPGLNLRTVHSFTGQFNGSEQEVRSTTYLYCYVGGAWLVKYRASSNIGFDADAEIERFIRTGPWPGRNAPPAPDETVMAPSPSQPSA